MMDVTFNSPYMRWEASDVKAGKDGWLEIPIHPVLVQAVAAGFSHGLVMGDEKGQTRENHDIFTREQAGAQPYLVVVAVPLLPKAIVPLPPPKAAPYPPAADLGSGAIHVPVGVGYNAHAHEVLLYRKTSAPKGELVDRRISFRPQDVVFSGLTPGGEYQVELRAGLGEGGWSNPEQPVAVVASPALAAPKPPASGRAEMVSDGDVSNGWWWQRLPGTGNFTAVKAVALGRPGVWPAVPAPAAPRNAWVGLQFVLMPPGGKAMNVSLNAPPLRFAGQAGMKVAPLAAWCFREWYVPKGPGWHAEALVPVKNGQKFDIPWADNKVTGQANQAIFVDLWVPRDQPPGPYKGAIEVSQDGRKLFEIPMTVEVAAATLADQFNVVGDMNTYDSPAGAMGVKTSDAAAFMEMERKYYRLAHAHRMTLNVLPYSQSGNINWRGAPKIGKDGRLDWAEWDERYGALLSGEAFTEKHGYVGPGAGVPIHHMYLPLHENWPAKLAEHFNPWPPPKDYDAFLKWTADLPAIEQCLGGTYPGVWKSAILKCATHLPGPTTRFQIYLNNKYYFREKGGRGISLWLLDEPMFADDFLALRCFGRLVREGLAPLAAMRMARPPAVLSFRMDISRPTHQRQWLDGLVHLNVCADQLYSQRRLIAYRKSKFGEEYWNYRMPQSFGGDNVGWAAWPVESLCWGATGTLPWQTIGSDGDLLKADETALMYPGRKFGLDEPIPSLRMKAWRDGLQTAELLLMLKQKHKWNDIQLRAFVGQVCGLSGWKDGMDPKGGAGIVTFRGMTAETLAQLTRAAISAIGSGD
jgi:hypothetical protein